MDASVPATVTCLGAAAVSAATSELPEGPAPSSANAPRSNLEEDGMDVPQGRAQVWAAVSRLCVRGKRPSPAGRTPLLAQPLTAATTK